MKARYRKCGKCKKKKAVWLYGPSGNRIRLYCDECVPRGCPCNIRNLIYNEPMDESNILYYSKEDVGRLEMGKVGSRVRKPDSEYYENLDEKGRRFPCSDYEWLGKQIKNVSIVKMPLAK